LRIGLLEDDLAIQEMVRLLLQSEGHEVTIYASAHDCLADVRIDDPYAGPMSLNLLLVDLRLSKSASGMSVIEQLRANPRLATLPIILMTASAAVDKRELERLQVALVMKPFDIDEILRLVNEAENRTLP
jgi:two-component system, chemotaxis family, chemotaxis protein CheY